MLLLAASAACTEATPRSANPCARSQYCIKYGACTVGEAAPEPRKEPETEPEEQVSPDSLTEALRLREFQPTRCNINGRRCGESTDPDSFALMDGTICAARKDADCRRAHWACRLEGRCAARDGRCVATSDADCRDSYRCERDGWCTAEDGRCVAGRDADCADSVACEVLGRCVEVDGACTQPRRERLERLAVMSEVDLESLTGPREPPLDWRAKYQSKFSSRFVARKVSSDAIDLDAAASKTIAEVFGGANAGLPKTPSPPDTPTTEPDVGTGSEADSPTETERTRDSEAPACENSDVCRKAGLCSPGSGGCMAADEEDCRSSEICRLFGRCRSVRGRCLLPEAALNYMATEKNYQRSRVPVFGEPSLEEFRCEPSIDRRCPRGWGQRELTRQTWRGVILGPR